MENGQAHKVVTHDHDDPLLNPRRVTVVGIPDGADGCTFRPPALELGPQQHALSMRQISTDFTNCTTVVEIGVPARVKENSEAGDSVVKPAARGAAAPNAMRSVSRGSRQLSLAAATSSGYYEIKFHDAAELDLNKTRARLTWSYDGSCTWGGSGSGYWWWASYLNWYIIDSESYAWLTGGGCGNSYYTHANGTFVNAERCRAIGPVYTFAKDVRFRGGYAGGIGGYVGEAYNTTTCLPLHWHGDLVRTS